MDDFTDKRCREAIRTAISHDSYESWFNSPSLPTALSKHGFNDNTLVVEAYSPFMQKSIIKRFGSKLDVVAKNLGFSRCCIIIKGEEVPEAIPPRDDRDLGYISEEIQIFAKEMKEREKQRHFEAMERMKKEIEGKMSGYMAS